MHEATWWARKNGPGRALTPPPPHDDMTMEELFEKLLRVGVEVNVCCSCMREQSIAAEDLMPGVHIIDGINVLEKKDKAWSVLSFV